MKKNSFNDSFPQPDADKAGDFVDAIGALNKKENFDELPPIFPTQASLEDSSGKDDVPALKLNKKHLKAKYARFNLENEEDIERLENINNRVFTDGWVMGREEWVHTKSGSTYVIVKYIENHSPKKKAKEAVAKAVASKTQYENI